ncbi:MAG: histidine triad nucleotide-binding protein [Deltaproteobacteria bacterium]|nr:histidine triad nucleotide-binding protein [Deltaproteobacteria bacterium]
MTIFQKILDGEIPAHVVYEDERVLAFRDIHPAAPVHVLIIPRKPLIDVRAAEEEDALLLGHMILVSREVARREGVLESGYRLVINNGTDAGQEVFHLHLHVMGGARLGGLAG